MEGRALGGLKPVSSAPRVANVHPNITPSPRVPQLSVRGKNRKELLGGFLRNVVKSADEALITSMSGLKVTPGAPLDSTQGLKSTARIEAQGGYGREATGLQGDCATRLSVAAILLVTWCKWVLSCSLRRWMTSLSLRGLPCWSTTPTSRIPTCGQAVWCTPTSVRRAQGALDSLPLLPSSLPSHWRAGNPASGHKHQEWRLMCRPVGSDGGLFPTGLADDYFPISSALSSLGRNTGNQPAENVRPPCHPSCLFCACNAISAHQESLWKSISSRWEVQKCLLGFGK